MDRQEGAGEGGCRDRDRGSPGVHRRSGHSDERRGFRVLGCRPHFPTESGALQGELQSAEEDDCDGENEHTEVRHGQLGGQAPTGGGDGASQ
ncbi:MAG: hypothetical protein WB586_24405 [Chthoniobacterales bacterium]